MKILCQFFDVAGKLFNYSSADVKLECYLVKIRTKNKRRKSFIFFLKKKSFKRSF